MFKRFKVLQAQQGFTLVELMVVVAIIGLLSAVAIPNFQKYQARAKTSEAKLQLSAAYTAESSFYADYNMYHSCLNYMGFDPSAEAASRYYTIGINVAAAIDTYAYGSAVNAGLNNDAALGCPQNLAPTANRTYFLAGKYIGNAIANNTHLPVTGIGAQQNTDNMTYTIGAAGVIQQKFTAASSSALTINQAKVLSNVRNGY